MLDAWPTVAARYHPVTLDDDGLQFTAAGTLELFLCVQLEEATSTRLRKMFDHDAFRRQFGRATREVANVLTEYVLNCLHGRKGGARRVAISLDGTELVVEDDGRSFDPLDFSFEPLPNQVGLKTIRGLMMNQPCLQAGYGAKIPDGASTFNRFAIQVRGQGLVSSSCSVHIDAAVLFTRHDGHAHFDQMDIPRDCDPFTVHIGTGEYSSSSGTHEVLWRLRTHLGERKLNVIVAPHRPDLYAALEPSVSHWPNVSLLML